MVVVARASSLASAVEKLSPAPGLSWWDEEASRLLAAWQGLPAAARDAVGAVLGSLADEEGEQGAGAELAQRLLIKLEQRRQAPPRGRIPDHAATTAGQPAPPRNRRRRARLFPPRRPVRLGVTR